MMNFASTEHWFPKHIANMTEFKEVVKAYDFLLTQALEYTKFVLQNQFLEDMTEEGCAIREKILGIVPNPSDTLEDRRRRITGYYCSDLPYTRNKLDDVLATMCGENGYIFEVDYDNQKISIGIKLDSIRLVPNVYEVIDRMRPCNMELFVEVIFNRHSVLSIYPHFILSYFTHEEVRAEVLDKLLSAECDVVDEYTCDHIADSMYTCDTLLEYGIRRVL